MPRKMKYAIAPAVVAVALAALGVQAADSAKHEAQAIEKSRLTLAEAIRKAEKQGDGQAISAEYEFKGGNPAYFEVKVLRNDGQKLTRYDLDPQTGKIKETSTEAFEKLFTRLKPAAIQHAPTSLARAISTAERQSGGKATMAEVDRDGDQLKYTVKTVKLDGSSQKIEVNGSDGKVASAK